jgi:hypothetical protein
MMNSTHRCRKGDWTTAPERKPATRLITEAEETVVSTDDRPAVLKRLDGDWAVTGSVRGKSVRYTASAVPALQAKFTEVSMKDVETPSQYEARVFIGLDGDSNQVIAHWMDSFGARYSIPHGVGSMSADAIEFVVPYPDGSFRDRFVYDAEGDSWSLEITAQRSDGSWGCFAEYSFIRMA